MLAIVLLMSASQSAQAQGFFDLLNQAFGGGGGRSQPAPQPEYGQPDSPPLTVRAKPRRHRPLASHTGTNRRYDVAEIRNVTIYTDKTLERGDAVMTPNGIRVFKGSSAWPHTDDDFVAIADSGKVPTLVRKELTALDGASRPELRR